MKPILYAAAALILSCAPAAMAKTHKDASVQSSSPPPAQGEPLARALPAYAAFQSDISLVNGGSIREPKDIERAMDKAAALNRDALTKGIIAYGALTAARNQTFVDGVRKTAAFYGRNKTVNGFILSLKYAQSLEGGAQATTSIVHFAAADANRIFAAGDSVKQRAHEAQNMSWGKADAGSAAPRTKRLKALADAAGTPSIAPELAGHLKIAPGDPMTDPNGFGGEAFWRSINAPPPAAAPSASVQSASLSAPPMGASQPTALSPDASPTSWTDTSGGADIRSKMVTLAALYALDATTERADDVDKLLNDTITNGCLHGAQLQFYQCVASAKFNYENMACIGEAGLRTVGACVSDIAH